MFCCLLLSLTFATTLKLESMETQSWKIITKINSLISHLYLLNLGKSFGCTQELSLPQHSLHSVRHAISVLLYKHPIFYRCVICPRVWEPYCVQFTSFCVKLALIIVYIWIYIQGGIRVWQAWVKSLLLGQ